MSTDRTVHGWMPDGTEVARYDRAGAWYLEHPEGGRTRVRVGEAAEYVAKDGRWFPHRSGGLMFDALVRKARGL